MDTQINEPLVPENVTGKPLDLSESVTAEDLETAINTYNRACTRLLNPKLWKEVSGTVSATFFLKGEQNEDVKRLAKVEDFIRIDIPGPGSTAGDGFDWVKVESIVKDMEPGCDDSFGMRLRSSANPNSDKEEVAHFFNADATSSFLVKRKNNIVTVSYHGRNEMPNTSDVNVIDKMRNTVVAAGAMLGFSQIQWSGLIKGLLKPELGE